MLPIIEPILGLCCSCLFGWDSSNRELEGIFLLSSPSKVGGEDEDGQLSTCHRKRFPCYLHSFLAVHQGGGTTSFSSLENNRACLNEALKLKSLAFCSTFHLCAGFKYTALCPGVPGQRGGCSSTRGWRCWWSRNCIDGWTWICAGTPLTPCLCTQTFRQVGSVFLYMCS